MKSILKNQKYKYLVETALLGHGLNSIEDSLILSLWPKDANLVWIQEGKITIGNIDEFLFVKNEKNNWERLNGKEVSENKFQGKNAFLTASGTMEVAKLNNCQMVVTAGLGGIGDIKGQKMSYDLIALSNMEITLIATSPKDMLDIQGTINWLNENKVNIYGFNTNICDGYIFVLKPIEIGQKIIENNFEKISKGSNLVLNPISREKRFKNIEVLKNAICAGKDAEKNGEYYHPAVNAYIDIESKGLSSIIQLESLISNIEIAKKLG